MSLNHFTNLKKKIANYFGNYIIMDNNDKKEIVVEDWENIKEILEEVRTGKTKYDVLYWSEKSDRGYIVRTNKNNLEIIYK